MILFVLSVVCSLAVAYYNFNLGAFLVLLDVHLFYYMKPSISLRDLLGPITKKEILLYAGVFLSSLLLASLFWSQAQFFEVNYIRYKEDIAIGLLLLVMSVSLSLILLKKRDQ